MDKRNGIHCFFSRFLILALILLPGACALAGEHPNMFINQAEINAIQAKINSNQEPWKTAYTTLISAANSALSVGIRGVTDNGGTPTKHEWGMRSIGRKI